MAVVADTSPYPAQLIDHTAAAEVKGEMTRAATLAVTSARAVTRARVGRVGRRPGLVCRCQWEALLP